TSARPPPPRPSPARGGGRRAASRPPPARPLPPPAGEGRDGGTLRRGTACHRDLLQAAPHPGPSPARGGGRGAAAGAAGRLLPPPAGECRDGGAVRLPGQGGAVR